MMSIYMELNVEYLDHDTLTDISLITLWVMEISGDCLYFCRKGREDIKDLRFSFDEELKPHVLVHGMLHYCGYKDKSEEEDEDDAQQRGRKTIIVPREAIV
jgi:ssRNA-specific RNase YbeY (16S rRNA maturation enzyme)